MGKRHRRQVESVDLSPDAPTEPVRKTKVAKSDKPAPKKPKGQSTASENPKPRKDRAKGGTSNEAKKKQDDEVHSYWLMKAEPESRIEKGKDVKFSIDDLAAAKVPEGWDGVRNAVARNNMRAMQKGDLAFFYHSNCKVPGIAGMMEIVQEHSPDTTAHDPKHPYYDPKDSAENPKWSLVHVEHRRTFPRLIPLKELQKYRGPGGKLENLQTLKQSRLSVSKVSAEEWEFILGLLDADDNADD